MRQSTIKVTYAGETKRLTTPADFSQLLQSTLLNFATLAKVGSAAAPSHKFFLLDEDDEMISISSQADFDDNSDQIILPAESAGISQSVPALIYSDSATDAAAQLKALMQSKLANAAALGESTQSRTAAQDRNKMMQVLEKGLQDRISKEIE